VAARRAPGSSLPETPRVTVPNLIKDPIWSLKPWPVEVTIKGRDMVIPALPAVDWLAVLMQPELNLDEFIEEFIPEADELLDEDLVIEELYEFCLDVISSVSGRPWWTAMRLIGVAREHWHILGPEMMKYDITSLALSGWLDALLVTVLYSMDPKDTAMFSLRLETPPPEVETKPEELEMSADTFLSLGQ